MSSLRQDDVAREAIWTAHARKCAYTHEIIDLDSMEIDHIIPQALSMDNVALRSTLERLGLSKDFDVHGFDNLLPVKSGVNSRKGANQFNESTARYFLDLAARKKREIQANIIRINRFVDQGKALVMLRRSLNQGKVEIGTVAKLIKEWSASKSEVFSLLHSLKFIGEEEVVELSKESISTLRTKRVLFGGREISEGLTLVNEQEGRIIVQTCQEYEEALNAGYYPYTTYAIKMATYFEQQSSLLSALEVARLPIKSFIVDPRAGITDLHLLPLSLFPVLGESRWSEAEMTSLTYQDKVDAHELVIRRVRQNELIIAEPEGMGQRLIEAARADFDGDGIEDILLFDSAFATHGTFGVGGVTIITRRGPSDRFERLELSRQPVSKP